jgi:hypothetical protein
MCTPNERQMIGTLQIICRTCGHTRTFERSNQLSAEQLARYLKVLATSGCVKCASSSLIIGFDSYVPGSEREWHRFGAHARSRNSAEGQAYRYN